MANPTRHFSAPSVSFSGCLLILLAGSLPAHGSDLNAPPIRYSEAPARNCVSQLEARLASGEVRLKYEGEHGYLKPLLEALDVPLSSQVLVFSKTSLQRHRIAPKTPRAIYFNDDVYVGFCLQGDVLEISVADPELGTVFYTIDQEPAERPELKRQQGNCLVCHGGAFPGSYPGHLVRSVHVDHEGIPLLALGSLRVDQTTPLGDRWGGWYVTGTSGRQTHRGNCVLPARTRQLPEPCPTDVNVTDLRERFTVASYPTPHSDIVALMVLEHQAEMHNRIARATLETRQALYQQEELDRALGKKSEELSETTQRRIQSVCEPLVRYMLFADEVQLTDRITGTSTYARDFARHGPRDRQGRSLRELDLKRRLFRYPCSYLIYSSPFKGLPAPAREYVYRRLWEVLSERDSSPAFAQISGEDRWAIRNILAQTLDDLPDYWLGR